MRCVPLHASANIGMNKLSSSNPPVSIGDVTLRQFDESNESLFSPDVCDLPSFVVWGDLEEDSVIGFSCRFAY
jgi:hypothetical protein